VVLLEDDFGDVHASTLPARPAVHIPAAHIPAVQIPAVHIPAAPACGDATMVVTITGMAAECGVSHSKMVRWCAESQHDI
jgi:hypothetical protein